VALKVEKEFRVLDKAVPVLEARLEDDLEVRGHAIHRL